MEGRRLDDVSERGGHATNGQRGLTMLKRLMRALLGARIGDRIDGLVAARRFQEALDLLEAELAKRDYPVAWRVWELQLHHLLGHDEWVATKAPELMREIPQDRFLSEHDRRYLKEYVSLAAQYSFGNVSGNKDEAIVRFPVNYAGLDLSKVSSLLRRSLPLDTHPEWQARYGR